MSEIVLQVRRREPGRSNARKLRRESQVPGIYYFHGAEPISICAAELALRPLVYTTESHIVRMTLDDGTEKSCVLKDVDFDPVTDRVVHFDLQGVAADETIRVEIPVVLVGSAIGARNGGIVDWVLHRLEIECLPQHLPEHIDVDISDVEIGGAVHVSDLRIDNISILTHADLSILTIAAPRTGDVVMSTEGPIEPELITKAKGEA